MQRLVLFAIAVTLYNFGAADTAYGVTARLHSDNPGITVTRDLANYGSINPMASGAPDQPFLINIGSDIANGTVVPLSLEISDNASHSWPGVFRLPVLAPQIAFDSVSIVSDNGNGQIDPGELFGLVFYARNIGPKTLFNPRAVLRSGDTHIQLIDTVATLGNILANDTASNGNHQYFATCDQSAYIGRHVNFNVVFTGAGPQVAATSFSKTVGILTPDGGASKPAQNLIPMPPDQSFTPAFSRIGANCS